MLSGGFRAGKTLPAIVKLIAQHCSVPNNCILIGRLTYPELRTTVQRDFFALLPPEWIDRWIESKGELYLTNGTLVLFKHLDSVSEFELRGLNLGAALIDQVEEISEEVYKTVKSRLSLQTTKIRQLITTCNPLLFWGYKYFKQESDSARELIEFSMLDNKANLQEDYLADMLKQPESWKRQFVYGVWDESLLSNRSIIPIEYITQHRAFEREPIRMFDDIAIYEDCIPSHSYQMGVDVSEGLGKDYSSFSIVDCNTGNQVAFWRGQIPPDILATKVVPIANVYNTARIVPEINGIGLAFLVKLKDLYENIYHRKDFDRETNEEKETLGWKTTFSTKPLLIDNFLRLCRNGMCKVRSSACINEMPTFVYKDTVKSKGTGAEEGFYDDCLIGLFLAYWDLEDSIRTFETSFPNFDNLAGAGRGGW